MQEYAHEFARSWYHVPSLMARRGGIYVLRAGRNLTKPGYRVGPKTIECHSIHFVLEGEVAFHHRNTVTILRKGDAFCMYPEQSYVYERVSDSTPLSMIWIAMGGAQVPDLLQMAGFRETEPYIRGRIRNQVRSELYRVVQTEPHSSEEELLSMQGLYTLFRHLVQSSAALTEQPLAEHTPDDWVRESESYIRLHYTEPISINDIAAKFGIHRSHFSSRFTKETGISPKQYLSQLRMDKGKQLLVATDLNITEIALTLGYSDLYAFTRAFTAYCGLSPSGYRHELRGTSSG